MARVSPYEQLLPGAVLVLLLLTAALPCAALAAEGASPVSEETGIEYSTLAAPEAIAPTGLAELDGYLREAAEQNPGLRAAFEAFAAAYERTAQAETLPDPMLTFGYFLRSVETRVGAQRASIGLSQSFPWLGTLSLKGEQAEQETETLRAVFNAKRLALFKDVKDAYYELAYLTKALQTTREQIALIKFLERIATARYTAGLAANADVIRTQIALGRLEDRLKGLTDLRHPLAARLNAALNREPTHPVPLPEEIPVLRVCATDEALHQAVAEANPQVLAAASRIESAEASVALAEKAYYPKLTVGLSTVITDEAMNRATPDSGKDPVLATFGFTLPIWRDSLDAGVREAEASVRLAIHERRNLVNTLSRELELALYGYHEAERKIELYAGTLIPKARQSLQVTLEGYQNGRGTALDLLDVEGTLLEFRLAYYRALADQAKELARLELLVGREIPCEAVEPTTPEPLIPEPAQ